MSFFNESLHHLLSASKISVIDPRKLLGEMTPKILGAMTRFCLGVITPRNCIVQKVLGEWHLVINSLMKGYRNL